MTQIDPFVDRRIDGPIGDHYLEQEPSRLAANLITGLGSFAWWMYASDELASKPQGYRLTSWVESPSDPETNVLLLSRPEPIRHTQFGGYHFTAKFFSVNTTEKTVERNPTILVSKPDKSPEDSAADIVKAYTPRDMATALSMLIKIQIAINHEDYHMDIDPLVSKVFLGHDDHIDALSVWDQAR